MIVREKPDSYLLIRQYDHGLASGEFALRWSEQPYPRESTLHAVSNHDIAWREPDAEALWNEEMNRPYSFVDYPVEPKVRAYTEGLNLLEQEDPYAACLCSMHYEKLVRGFGKTGAERSFADAESHRQEELRGEMSAQEIENLGRNLSFLRLCDGLSLFVCLNEPGVSDRPPPYPEGFEFDGRRYEAVWEDESVLRLDPNPFSESFEVSIPYRIFGDDRRFVRGGDLEFRVIC